MLLGLFAPGWASHKELVLGEASDNVQFITDPHDDNQRPESPAEMVTG